jgi:hypothetical protein
VAALALATSALIFLAVPERARTAAMPSTPRQQLQGLAQVFRDRLFWRLAPMNCAVSATAFSLQGLWAGPWLRDVAGLDPVAVAEHLLVLAGAMTLCMALSGLATEFARRYRIGLIAVMAAGIGVYMSIQVVIVLEAISAALVIWALFGLFSNVNALAYTVLSQHFPSEVTDRAITGFNVLLFSAAFAAQYAIGAVIEQ